MRDIKYEYIQRIPSHYVGDDCIQIMMPHRSGPITILNSDGMTYHYEPNSSLFVNEYVSDERKEQFPYSQIPTHKCRVKGKKFEYINQLLDFNRVYIQIANGVVKEYYTIKDGDEALLATKYIRPSTEITYLMTREKVIELIRSANGIYSPDGKNITKVLFPNNERLIACYRDEIIQTRIREGILNSWPDKDLTEFIYKSIDKLTIDDVPEGITVLDNIILVTVEENEISSIQGITVKFMHDDCYKVDLYPFPITIYSLAHIKQLEQTNFAETPEPKFPRVLNPKINFTYIKGDKEHVQSLIRSKNKRRA